MWVVKLGGSLAHGDALTDWLDALLDCPPLVLVPGGGPFADQVRVAQSRWGFDDATAHHLALLAMEQYGRMLCGLRPALVPAATAGALTTAVRAGTTAVWMPVGMALADPAIPRSWDMTSDSLAAWLAARLGATGLLLIKSARLDPDDTLERLAATGVVDPLLPRLVATTGGRPHLLSTADPRARERLRGLIQPT